MRERNVPFLATGDAHDLVLVEIARNVMGMKDAGSRFYDEEAADPVVKELPRRRTTTKRVGRPARPARAPGPGPRAVHPAVAPRGAARPAYGINLDYASALEEAGLRPAGFDAVTNRPYLFVYEPNRWHVTAAFLPQMRLGARTPASALLRASSRTPPAALPKKPLITARAGMIAAPCNGISGTIKRELEAVAASASGFVELRYHRKKSRIRRRRERPGRGRDRAAPRRRRRPGDRGRTASGSRRAGPPRSADLDAAIERARRRGPRLGRRAAASGFSPFPAADLVRGHFEGADVADCDAKPFEEKVELARGMEARARGVGLGSISSATCVYTEIFEEKAIVTSDGASASFSLVRPEFRVAAVAMRNGERQVGTRSIGATGGWDCLFRREGAGQLAEQSAQTAVDLLSARRPEGGRRTVILAPSIVGLLVHEAIGHTVEADFVSAGSVAAGKIGQRVASDLVTLCDSGQSELAEGAGGLDPGRRRRRARGPHGDHPQRDPRRATSTTASPRRGSASRRPATRARSSTATSRSSGCATPTSSRGRRRSRR